MLTTFFLLFFSDFAVLGGLGGFQPQQIFVGDPQIFSEMTLAKIGIGIGIGIPTSQLSQLSQLILGIL